MRHGTRFLNNFSPGYLKRVLGRRIFQTQNLHSFLNFWLILAIKIMDFRLKYQEKSEVSKITATCHPPTLRQAEIAGEMPNARPLCGGKGRVSFMIREKPLFMG